MVIVTCQHRTSFDAPDRYGRRLVTVKYHKHVDNFPIIDAIKMQSGKGGNATVLPVPPEEGRWSDINLLTVICVFWRFRLFCGVDKQHNHFVPMPRQPRTPKDHHRQSGVSGHQPEYEKKLPIFFHDVSAIELLRIQVPDHVKTMWLQISPTYNVKVWLRLWRWPLHALSALHYHTYHTLSITFGFALLPWRGGNEKRILVGFEDPYILYNVDGVSPVRIEIWEENNFCISIIFSNSVSRFFL